LIICEVCARCFGRFNTKARSSVLEEGQGPLGAKRAVPLKEGNREGNVWVWPNCDPPKLGMDSISPTDSDQSRIVTSYQ
jgi:hypothetical protein